MCQTNLPSLPVDRRVVQPTANLERNETRFLRELKVEVEEDFKWLRASDVEMEDVEWL
jgi:hypothetical protein